MLLEIIALRISFPCRYQKHYECDEHDQGEDAMDRPKDLDCGCSRDYTWRSASHIADIEQHLIGKREDNHPFSEDIMDVALIEHIEYQRCDDNLCTESERAIQRCGHGLFSGFSSS